MNTLSQPVGSKPGDESPCALCVDMGTTHTRVWLVEGERIIARTRARLGIQDAALAGSSEVLRTGLAELLAQVRSLAKQNGFAREPEFVLAAGMITSPLGIANLPHISAPAGAKELAAAVQRLSFPELAELPFLFVPGVRCGSADLPAPVTADMMRGEETLCIGLSRLGMLKPSGTLLNLGSHWKAIRFDDQARIAASVTSLAGELIQAAHAHTLLASSLPEKWPDHLDLHWVDAGMGEQRRSGLLRALFSVRLHDQLGRTTGEQRFAFLIGAFIAADLDALSREFFEEGSKVLVAGSGGLAAAWQHALRQAKVCSEVISPDETETGFLAGLREVLEGRIMIGTES
jgi:2-dehydro-3-deoxygalactonokinase